MNKRILMIEDDIPLATSTREMLRMRGVADTSIAATVEEAITGLREDGPWDLILCDWELPDGFGPAALAWAPPEVPVILWSGLDRRKELNSRYPHVRVDHVITKSASLEALTLISDLLGVAVH